MSFWVKKPLDQLSHDEWEQLCDGCGKCCLNKIIDDDTEVLYYTNVACKLLDQQNGQCRQYDRRFDCVLDCTRVTLENIAQLTWLPQSCAYYRLYHRLGLPSWHPLMTGNKKAMHACGMSIRSKVVDEEEVSELEDYIVRWPLEYCD